MSAPRHKVQRPSRRGYVAAIAISAIGHAGLFTLVFLVMPQYLHSTEAPPPSYTVKIVDNMPAGDLGTRLPRLSARGRAKRRAPEQIAKAEEPKLTEPPKVEEPKPDEPKIAPPQPPAENDKNAISLSTSSPALTPTPTPTPAPPPPSAEATPPLPPHATLTPTPKPIARPATAPALTHPRENRAPKTVEPREHKKKAPIVVAKAEPTPNVQEQLAKIRQRLLAEHLKEQSEQREQESGEESSAAEGEPASESETGSGPVVGDIATEGHGLGIGPGTGSAGIQTSLDFLLYYRTVQEKIKKSWTFPGGSADLTTTVDFAIGPDGALTRVAIAKSSKDPAFDDSVVRAIRRAAPFPPPPEKYRSQFASGLEALFKLGELKS